ncbi:hypothetical protein AVEN_166811-1 [Araneus ventricosus]|uniref:Uncharacterized protein n=1 Tax=Araneus ventricosus TaxID=182803 RepID=A0A4Y2BNH0_ARAVE|nr:hypothetical protein AVEN_166811-1 [Araneus ventricosus]
MTRTTPEPIPPLQLSTRHQRSLDRFTGLLWYPWLGWETFPHANNGKVTSPATLNGGYQNRPLNVHNSTDNEVHIQQRIVCGMKIETATDTTPKQKGNLLGGKKHEGYFEPWSDDEDATTSGRIPVGCHVHPTRFVSGGDHYSVLEGRTVAVPMCRVSTLIVVQ